MNVKEYIYSVKYDKKSGEYTIKQKDFSGRPTITHANHLTKKEITFCKISKRFEDEWSIWWN